MRWPCASPWKRPAPPLVRVDFAAGQQRTPEYLAINPKGGCPRWHAPGHADRNARPGWPMWRRAFPQAGLAPADAYGFARAGVPQLPRPTAHRPRPPPRASRWADEPEAQAAMQRKVPQNMTDCFSSPKPTTSAKARGCWAISIRWPMATCSPSASWLQSDGDIAPFPVHAHTQRMLQRPPCSAHWPEFLPHNAVGCAAFENWWG